MEAFEVIAVILAWGYRHHDTHRNSRSARHHLASCRAYRRVANVAAAPADRAGDRLVRRPRPRCLRARCARGAGRPLARLAAEPGDSVRRKDPGLVQCSGMTPTISPVRGD